MVERNAENPTDNKCRTYEVQRSVSMQLEWFWCMRNAENIITPIDFRCYGQAYRVSLASYVLLYGYGPKAFTHERNIRSYRSL